MSLLLFAGCGSGNGNGGTSPAGSAGDLTGLYESGEGPRRDQLCMIGREGRAPSFGFIVWGAENRSCGGKGVVRREGDRLRLLLDGDESCTIEARLDGKRVRVTSGLSAECARYYCGAGTALGQPDLLKAGDTEADARRAVDLVGDPLCAG